MRSTSQSGASTFCVQAMMHRQSKAFMPGRAPPEGLQGSVKSSVQGMLIHAIKDKAIGNCRIACTVQAGICWQPLHKEAGRHVHTKGG